MPSSQQEWIFLLIISASLAVEFENEAIITGTKLKTHLLTHSKMHIYDVVVPFDFHFQITEDVISTLRASIQ